MNLKRIDDALEYIVSRCNQKPAIGYILGSGLGDYADNLADATIINYSDIPGFPVSTVEGHAGHWVTGKLHGKFVVMMRGRFHYYEGYSMCDVTLPVRVMARLGVKVLFVTNAAGGVNTAFSQGNLMLLTDHISMSGLNPLMGQNIAEFGVRFPDMSTAYDKRLRQIALESAGKLGITLMEGVYMQFSGPSFETPAEIRMARLLGADAVGMSTVPEVIIARHSDIKVIGISCITNMAAGMLDQPLNHAEVMETGERVKGEFKSLLDEITKQI